MFNKKLLINISIFFILIGIAFAAIPTDWSNPLQVITFVATLIGFILAGISLMIPNSYEVIIKKDDWKEDDKNYYFIIPAFKHGMGKSPKSSYYSKDENGKWNASLTSSNVDDKGNLTIFISKIRKIDLKVIVS